jgi:PKD repeat protein
MRSFLWWTTGVVGLILVSALTGCPPETPNGPVAAFAATPRSGPAPLTVHFNDISNAGDSELFLWFWEFGGEGLSDFSEEQNPTVVFTEPGVYWVSLHVVSWEGEDTAVLEDYITVTEGGEGEGEGEGESLALFDQVWTDFDQNYSYFHYKGIDWGALRDQYRPNFAGALGPDSFATNLAGLLAELRDLHIEVSLDGNYYPVYAREIQTNYTSTPRKRYLTQAADYSTLGGATPVVYHGWIGDNMGYVRVDTIADAFTNGVSENDVEALFQAYDSAAGLIIDIRPNNGGDETNAAFFVERMIDSEITYGHFQFRNGPGHDDFGAVQAKTLAPGTGTHYDGPVVGLIGERCMSSAEWFALMLRAAGATLIGDTTRGSSANRKTETLSNGVSYTLSRWIAYRPDMAEIEDRGITPDIAIAPESSFDGSRDYVMERALQELGSTVP